jgi:mRNA interferase YafQ
MRKIERTTQFKRDYKREAKGRHRGSLDSSFLAVLHPLVNDEMLIYEKPDDATLVLVRIGSHSELGW